MCQNFEKIPMPEQERIKRICLEEFAGKGYVRASTNAIVEKAGIPKGTLFYYFGSKKKMFFYMLDRAIERYIEKYRALDTEKPDDLFERLFYTARIKFRFAEQEPLLYSFFLKTFLDIPAETKAEMQQRFHAYTSAAADSIMEGLDLTLFKPEVNVDSLVEMVNTLLDGLLSRYSEEFREAEPAHTLEIVRQLEMRCREYFEMIKRGVYRSS